jgi:hypothetical protein
MNRSIRKFSRKAWRINPITCVWIETGDPRQPLTRIWVDARRNANNTAFFRGLIAIGWGIRAGRREPLLLFPSGSRRLHDVYHLCIHNPPHNSPCRSVLVIRPDCRSTSEPAT